MAAEYLLRVAFWLAETAGVAGKPKISAVYGQTEYDMSIRVRLNLHENTEEDAWTGGTV